MENESHRTHPPPQEFHPLTDTSHFFWGTTNAPHRPSIPNPNGDDYINLPRKHTSSHSSPPASTNSHRYGYGSHTPNTSNPWTKKEFVKLSPIDKAATLLEDGNTISLDEDAINANEAQLNRALVGKVLGKRPPYYFLNNVLHRLWGQWGNFKLIMVALDCFVCVFDTTEARDAVLMNGPWFAGGSIIGLDKWSSSFNPNSFHGLSSPIWVRFPNLPLLYWDNINLARIASFIGEPLWVDHQTNVWGQSLYARVCIRLDLSHKLPPGVWIQGRHGRFFQSVEYEGITQLCFNCGKVGHKSDTCPSKQASIPAVPTGMSPSSYPATTIPDHLPNTPPDPRHHKAMTNLPPVEPNHVSNTDTPPHSPEEYGPWVLVTRKKKPKSSVPPPVTKTTKPSPPIFTPTPITTTTKIITPPTKPTSPTLPDTPPDPVLQSTILPPDKPASPTFPNTPPTPIFQSTAPTDKTLSTTKRKSGKHKKTKNRPVPTSLEETDPTLEPVMVSKKRKKISSHSAIGGDASPKNS